MDWIEREERRCLFVSDADIKVTTPPVRLGGGGQGEGEATDPASRHLSRGGGGEGNG